MNKFVEKLSGLRDLGPAEIAAVEALTSRPRKYRAKHDLIREGDAPGPVFVMLEGWACRYKILPNGGRQIVAFLMPGDACDLHTNMVTEMDHSIQTVSAASVATIGRSDMNEAMARYPDFASAMYIAQVINEGTMRAWIVSMGRRSSIERVAHLTCELYIRLRKIGLSDDGRIELPLSQIVLADALGMTSVHLNRVFKELKSSKIMALSRGRLEILDLDKLVEIAGFDQNYLHRRTRHWT